MQRCNAIQSSRQEISGVLVMPSEKYALMVAARPDLQHLNAGDFYSQFDQNVLAEAMLGSLARVMPGSQGNVRIINASDLRTAPKDPETIYLAKGRNGVRINSSFLDSIECEDCRNKTYGILGLTSIIDLFSREKRGGIQEEIENLGAELRKLCAMYLEASLLARR